MRLSALLLLATTLFAQDGQHARRPGWPCVAGRPVDPAFIAVSESTGGQIFLLQPGEAAHTVLIASSSHTHPATILRAIGNLNGTRDFEFPVDAATESIQVMASLQCRNAIQVSRPDDSEMTAANSAVSVDLKAGRILRVDAPEAGKWRVRITGTGLFVLSVLAKTKISLGVAYKQGTISAYLPPDVTNVRFQLVGAAGDALDTIVPPEPERPGAYRFEIAPRADRFRVVATGTDAMGWPFVRTHPVLFSASSNR